jgi:hypothetical protein
MIPFPATWHYRIISVGSSRHNRFTKTRMRKPSSLNYWQTFPWVNGEIDLDIGVCKTYGHV